MPHQVHKTWGGPSGAQRLELCMCNRACNFAMCYGTNHYILAGVIRFVACQCVQMVSHDFMVTYDDVQSFWVCQYVSSSIKVTPKVSQYLWTLNRFICFMQTCFRCIRHGVTRKDLTYSACAMERTALQCAMELSILVIVTLFRLFLAVGQRRYTTSQSAVFTNVLPKLYLHSQRCNGTCCITIYFNWITDNLQIGSLKQLRPKPSIFEDVRWFFVVFGHFGHLHVQNYVGVRFSLGYLNSVV